MSEVDTLDRSEAKSSSGAFSEGERATTSTVASAGASATPATAAYTSTRAANGGSGGPERPQGKGSNDIKADEGDNLWSAILNSVKSSRSAPIKKIIVLGEAQSGKSTLLNRIAAASPSGFVSQQTLGDEEQDESLPDISVNSINGAQQSSQKDAVKRTELGLSFGYFDVGDDDGEDVVARVGVYQLSSMHPASVSLLPFALLGSDGATNQDGKVNDNATVSPNAASLRDALFLITLDWESPWTFLSRLIECLDVIRQTVRDCQAGDAQLFDELKQDIEAYIRSYSEPLATTDAAAEADLGEDEEVGNTSTASAIIPVSAYEDENASPLPDGCLTENYGVSIVVVCTKADTIQQLERQRNFKEEQFDYIQQVLRTICLRYGAALFFTSHSRPASFDVLREYVLHRLLVSASNRDHSATTNSFQFRHRASTVERDVLVVPAGWDSFGKIRALREGFDCASMAAGWEWDCQVERARRSQPQATGAEQPSVEAPGGVVSAIRLYEDIIEDWGAAAKAQTNSGNARVKEPDEQSFLLAQYNALQRDPEPRLRIGARANAANSGSSSTNDALKPSVVGPLGSAGYMSSILESGINDENRAAYTPTSATTGKQAKGREGMASTNVQQPPQQTPLAALRGQGTSSNVPSNSSQPSSGVHSPANPASRPTSPLSGSPSMSTPKQSEVLHSFFQSLLKEKTAPGGAGGGGPGAKSMGNLGNSARKPSQSGGTGRS